MENKAPNEGAAVPCFNHIEESNIKFSQNQSIPNNNINKINEQINNLNIKEDSKEKKILKPRDYQQKIFDKAKNQNSIIYVETGKGKTFISIMLMANHLGIELNNPSNSRLKIDENKKIIFFVCDTALIEQQKKAISDILKIEVGTIQGKKNKRTKSDYQFFKKMWDSLNIFVAIPSIIYKFLSCGFLKIFDISMLIFDECHHTGDDHPYNKIMEEFYFFYKRKANGNLNYPRIYGLTASPLKKCLKGSVEASIIKAMEKLSENLDSVVVIDPEMTNSNAKYMKPGESIEQYLKDDSFIEVASHNEMPEFKKVIYKVYNECFLSLISIAFLYFKKSFPENTDKNIEKEYAEYVHNKFKAHSLEEYNIITEKYIHMYNLRKISIIFDIFENIQRQIFMILENLCLDSLILYFDNLIENYRKLHIKKLEEEKINPNNKNNKPSDKSLIIPEDFDSDSDRENDEIKEYNLNSGLIQDINDVFIQTNTILKNYRDIEKKDYVSDRLQKLYIKIDDLFKKNEKSKFIIFIANRIVAHYLHPELNNYLKAHYNNKKCKEIIGINKRTSKGGTTLTPSLTLKEMNEIIKQFNEDKFNILIGTSAIEEGLDIQSCNAVLTLVELRTPKSFIQIKGRARKSNSDFIIFTHSAKEGLIKIKEFLKIGQKINELFENDIMQDFRRDNYISSKEDFKFVFDKRSHAKLTMGNVSIFYNEIIQQIKASKIKFICEINVKKVKSHNKLATEFEFDGIVNLKTDLDEMNEIFPKTFHNINSKENAQKLCFFYVLDSLKKYNYLDQYLKFIKEKN